jgi:hypothetical protein
MRNTGAPPPWLQSLTPTYAAHLDGLPGFTTNVEYSVTGIASKTKNLKLGIGVSCVSFLILSLPFSPLGLFLFVVGPIRRTTIPKRKAWTKSLKSLRTHRTVSTPFVYCPRARPARGIPPRLEPTKRSPGLRLTSEWRTHENVIAARILGSSSPSSQRDITCKVRRQLARSLARFSFFPKKKRLTDSLSTVNNKKDLYARVACAVHAPRDPVPYHVHGARVRLGNAPHLPALTHGRCCAYPRVLAG